MTIRKVDPVRERAAQALWDLTRTSGGGGVPWGQVSGNTREQVLKEVGVVLTALLGATVDDGGELDAFRAALARSLDRELVLRDALRPFAKLADSWTVQHALHEKKLLTLTNGERMCGIEAAAFERAAEMLKQTAEERVAGGPGGDRLRGGLTAP